MEKTAAPGGGTPVDETDLHIMRLLSANCRSSYRTIASTVDISTNAVKTRVKNMLSKGVIQRFIVVVNPAIFGYGKLCLLIMRNSDKIITKQEGGEGGVGVRVSNQLNLFGDVWVYTEQLGGAAIFWLLLRPDVEDKIELMNNLLKPAIVEYKFVTMNPPSMNVNISDLKIIKCLLSNARMEIVDIAKGASISPRTVTKRIEKLQQHHIIDFSIIRSMNSAGYIEFLLLVDVNKSAYGEIIERMYSEMQEYLIIIPLNITGIDVIIALFFCSNIPTVDSIVRKIKSYDGVQGVELFIITKVAYHQEWLERQINKRLRSDSKITTIGLPAAK